MELPFYVEEIRVKGEADTQYIVRPLFIGEIIDTVALTRVFARRQINPVARRGQFSIGDFIPGGANALQRLVGRSAVVAVISSGRDI